MGLSRRRDNNLIWPGFVDAVTTLLMVVMFILTIFTVMQSVLQDRLTAQKGELDSLSSQVAQLAEALGLAETRGAALQAELGNLTANLAERDAALGAAEARIAGLTGEVSDLTASLAAARSEVDKQTEEARLAAARASALDALLADLRAKSAADAQALTAAEAARLVDQAALAALRDKLKTATDEQMAMTLALEEARRKAEETLTLLAASKTVAAQAAGEVDQQKALLALAEQTLTAEQEKSLESARKLALLNEQVAALRAQLGQVQGLLDAANIKDSEAATQLEVLGNQLNAALAQVAAEQKRRAVLEAAEAERLRAENADLARFRSEFFGQLSKLLAGREGVRVVGDRFVFSSEVLFTPGAASLAEEGRAQIAGVTATLTEVAAQIPDDLNWIIRVDGHTDNLPLSGNGAYSDNWELSQARALSVVRYMVDELGFPPEHLAATGFGEFQPVTAGDTAEARAQNRRIELKLTER